MYTVVVHILLIVAMYHDYLMDMGVREIDPCVDVCVVWLDVVWALGFNVTDASICESLI